MEELNVFRGFEMLRKRRKAQNIREKYVAGISNSRREDFERKVREAQYVR